MTASDISNDKTRASVYLRILASVVFILTISTAFLNWRIDPLQYYRKAAYPPEFSESSRYQNPGLARNYPYDALVIGSSVSLGFDTNHLREKLGWNALNLAMSGGTAHEQRLLLDVAMRTGRARHVLRDLNFEFSRGRPDWVTDYDGAFPGYFYDEQPLTKISNYLLNIDVTKKSIRVLLRRCGLHLSRQYSELADLTRPDPARKAGRQAVVEKWKRAEINGWPAAKFPGEFSSENLRASFDENVFEPIRSHPEIQFDLYFPPFSFAYYAIMQRFAPEAFQEMFRWKQYVLDKTHPLRNVRVHDFQGVPEIVLDLDRYVDPVHYTREVHDVIIDGVASGRYLATKTRLVDTEAMLRTEAKKKP
ncbi:MAG: hypothetical protein WCP06_03955 [Verrucomicrobiota bacterium]